MRILRFEMWLLGLIFVLFTGAKLLHLSEKERPTHTAIDTNITEESLAYPRTTPQLIVLGIAQDAGYPQADCRKSCCEGLWTDKHRRKMVSCLGLRNPISNKVYLFDATPDIKDQLQLLKNQDTSAYQLGGIFLTHAHMGHYTGLMQFGREAMGATEVPVYVMPRMRTFLTDNGPWSQLVSARNILLHTMEEKKEIDLGSDLRVLPILVPHRDEYSETVGYVISSKRKKVLFIPDIDKWEKWDSDINDWIGQVDIAFLDGTFYRNGEIWGRDMSQIPHPFIEESIKKFSSLTADEKSKIHFIHLNHTNPLLDEASEEYATFQQSGYNLARELQIVEL